MAHNRKQGIAQAAVALLTFGIFLVAHRDALTDPYRVNDDVRQQIFWMQSWTDPGCYADDWLADYARRYVPPGIRTVYHALARVVPPLVASQWIPGVLLVILCLILFNIGLVLRGPVLAWMTAASGWLMPCFLDNLAGGIAHSFAPPLLAACFLAWIRRSSLGILLTLLLEVLFVPYLFLLSGGALLMAWASAQAGITSPPPFPRRLRHFAALLAMAAVAWAFSREFMQAGYGPLVSKAEMIGRPEFGPSGRYEIFPFHSLAWDLVVVPWSTLAPFRELGTVAGVLVCVSLPALLIIGLARIDWRPLAGLRQPACCLALSSLGLYAAAKLFALRLFVPDRYVMYPAQLLYAVGIPLCLLAVPWPSRWRPASRALPALAILLGALRLQNVGLFDYSGDRSLCEAVRARLPPGARVAGHPALMDNVVTFARRPVLASFELAHPWSRGAWSRMRPALEDTFRGYYADDPAVIDDIERRRAVRAWIVDRQHFQPSFLSAQPFFEPFDAFIRRETAGRTTFALLSTNHFVHTKIDGNRFIATRRTREP